ncbi:MAG: hypothetical protein FWE72_05675 [Spirochaetaceae bacterium]|nr:hypothetical protein [Spirochaetaceae bacterium]
MLKLIKKSFFVNAEKFMLFLFFSAFFTFLLYITGNFQNFLDSNQIMLIEVADIISVVLLVCSVFYGSIIMVTNAAKHIRKKRKTRKYMFFISLFIFSTTIFFISRFILVWTR